MKNLLLFLFGFFLFSGCTAQKSSLQFYSVNNYDYFINIEKNVAIFIELGDGVRKRSVSKNIKNVTFHSKGLLITDSNRESIIYSIDTDLRNDNSMNRMFFGGNYSVNRSDESILSNADQVIEVSGIGIVQLEDDGSVPEAISCKCRQNGSSDSDCSSGGVGSDGCSVGTEAEGSVLGVGGGGSKGCSIKCKGTKFACCK